MPYQLVHLHSFGSSIISRGAYHERTEISDWRDCLVLHDRFGKLIPSHTFLALLLLMRGCRNALTPGPITLAWSYFEEYRTTYLNAGGFEAVLPHWYDGVWLSVKWLNTG